MLSLENAPSQETLARVLFRHYEVSSVLFAPSHLLPLFTLGIKTALVLDVGHRSIFQIYFVFKCLRYVHVSQHRCTLSFFRGISFLLPNLASFVYFRFFCFLIFSKICFFIFVFPSFLIWMWVWICAICMLLSYVIFTSLNIMYLDLFCQQCTVQGGHPYPSIRGCTYSKVLAGSAPSWISPSGEQCNFVRR